MEKFVKILLQGIQNRIEQNHQYPWLGLDDNHHLKMVFEPGTSVQLLKDLEQGLKNFSEKNALDKDSLISKDDSQPYKRYTIHLDLNSLHQLLLKQSPSYKQHGALLSILNPNHANAKPDVICFGPVEPKLKRFRYGKSNILDMMGMQLENFFPENQYDPNLLLTFMQKHIGFSGSDPINFHQLHPECQMVPLTEDTRFIYSEKTGLPFEELDQLLSLEIPLQSFVSSYLEFLNDHLEALEQEYTALTTQHDPSKQLQHLHSELHLYEQCIHQLQQHDELKANQKSAYEIEPVLNHIGLFLAWLEVPHPDRLERIMDMMGELPYLSNISEAQRERLMLLYTKIINGDSSAFHELKHLQTDLFHQKAALTQNIQKIQQHLLLPIIEHVQSPQTGLTLFTHPSHTEHYDQQRLKKAVESPCYIPRLIEQLHKEINVLSQKFKHKHQQHAYQIENLKTHIEKLEQLLCRASPLSAR
jgi:hypothetical protein